MNSFDDESGAAINFLLYELINYCDKFFFGCAHFFEVYKPIVLAIPVAYGQDNNTL